MSENPESLEDKAIEKNLDTFIDEWGPDIRDKWTALGRFDDDFKSMHRTALISICRARQDRAVLAEAQTAVQQQTSAQPEIA